MFDAAVEKRTGLIGNFLQADGTDDFIHFHRFYSMTLLMFFYRRRRRRRRRGRSQSSLVRVRSHLVMYSSSHVLSCVFVCVFVFFPCKRENSNFQETPVFYIIKKAISKTSGRKKNVLRIPDGRGTRETTKRSRTARE